MAAVKSVIAMSKQLNLAARIRSMKSGDCFWVPDEKTRQSALRSAKALRDAGILTLRITTYHAIGPKGGSGFHVAALDGGSK